MGQQVPCQPDRSEFRCALTAAGNALLISKKLEERILNVFPSKKRSLFEMAVSPQI